MRLSSFNVYDAVVELRPGIVVKYANDGRLFLLLYLRNVDWGPLNGLNWCMLGLDDGALTGEFPDLLRGQYEVVG